MGLLTWLTRNWADTDDGDDPRLRPLELSLPLAEAMAKVEATLRALPRWQVEAVAAGTSTIQAERRTRLFHFVDDITVRCEALEEKRTRIHARSQSRVGKGDLGQNRRNLLKLWSALAASK